MDPRHVDLARAFLLQITTDYLFFFRHGRRLGRRVRRRRSIWVQNHLVEGRRREASHFYTLLNAQEVDMSENVFRNYTRVNLPLFLIILDKIRPNITRIDTNMRMAIEPGLKLAVALRYMATGDSFRSLSSAMLVKIKACRRGPA
eukprot:TRINITY_DN14893_c0_g1_i16.p1 TRINITY_DN14893_c0_g1~~TRINITY_DN14893_c0_g1_i16.p1  ORF type:complete len:145 (+),score=17.61 TRINITY_DN14893_c0_g1_i16:692-1126(+)